MDTRLGGIGRSESAARRHSDRVDLGMTLMQSKQLLSISHMPAETVTGSRREYVDFLTQIG